MITLSTTTLTTYFLIVIRCSGFLILSPFQAIKAMPFHVRLLMCMMLSLFILNSMEDVSLSDTQHALGVAVFKECCNGFLLSLCFQAAFGVFSISGQLIDTQIGFNSTAIFNPTDHSHEAISSKLLGTLALFYFMASGYLHELIQGLALSFRSIKPGSLLILNSFPNIIQHCSYMFLLGLLLASPIVLSLLIIDFLTALFSKNMPQINAYFLTLPLKIIIGLLVFSLSLYGLTPFFQATFTQCFIMFQGMLS